MAKGLGLVCLTEKRKGKQLMLKGQNIAHPEALEISWSLLQAQTDLHKAL